MLRYTKQERARSESFCTFLTCSFAVSIWSAQFALFFSRCPLSDDDTHLPLYRRLSSILGFTKIMRLLTSNAVHL